MFRLARNPGDLELDLSMVYTIMHTHQSGFGHGSWIVAVKGWSAGQKPGCRSGPWPGLSGRQRVVDIQPLFFAGRLRSSHVHVEVLLQHFVGHCLG